MREYLTKKELTRLGPESIQKLQNQRLAATVRHLAPHTPFYANFFKEHNIDPWTIKGAEDWKRLNIPLIRKVDYMKHPKEFIVSPQASDAFSVYRKYHAQYDAFMNISLAFKALFGRQELKKQVEQFFFPKMPAFSGGTEYGQPVPVFLTGAEKQQLHNMIDMIADYLQHLLPPERPRVGMNLFPYGPHLAWHAAHAALDSAVDLNLSTAAGGAIPTERLVALADAFKPTVFTGMAEYFRHRFLPLCQQKKAKLPPFALFVHGATMLLDTERALLQVEAAKAGIQELTVLNLFGASEIKTALLPECSPGTGFHHLNPLAAIIKTTHIESPTAYEFTPDAGNLVIWNISGAGTLLLGYVLGDHTTEVKTGPCAGCGLNVQRFFGITRAKDVQTQLSLTGIVEEKIKGARVNLIEIRSRVLTAGAQECQITVSKDRRKLTVAYAGRAGADKKIKQALESVEVHPVLKRVALQTFLKQPGFKFKPIILQ
ncbi:hypothetical protein HY490_04070 [Candidatus Woesearchaeota archaeon]|nr:hypothetical protein [Candidatus Woesearchaeota archaeon]